ncbi:glycosyl transferase family 1 [Halobacteriales archaeon QS_5_70_17]|nr:MAG: glycosyl transferase family 1 [Halobacteriales archaeon QS_5_70_17]
MADFTGNVGKVRRHVEPLSEVGEVEMVCVNEPDGESDVSFTTAPSVGIRPVDLLSMFAYAAVAGVRGEYDGIVSFSLLPHGCFALVVGRLSETPVHLGILGIDVDVHAEAWYRPLVIGIMRRFETITVPGSVYRRRLAERGVDRSDIEPLINSIPVDEYTPRDPERDLEYDCLWIGRFSSEKDPLLFVEAIDEYSRTDPEVSAVMVGDGPLRSEVAAAIEERGLSSDVDLVGWVDDPREYYLDARTLLITSERDALPLTLLEGMATGVACVTPPVGNVTDVVRTEKNGLLVPFRTPEDFARAIERLDDEELYETITSNAPEIRSRISYGAVAEGWRAVARNMGITEGSVGPTPSSSKRPVRSTSRAATGVVRETR